MFPIYFLQMSSDKWLLDIGFSYFQEETSSEHGDEEIAYSDQVDFFNEDICVTSVPNNPDPEYFPVKCFSVDEAKKLLNEIVKKIM